MIKCIHTIDTYDWYEQGMCIDDVNDTKIQMIVITQCKNKTSLGAMRHNLAEIAIFLKYDVTLNIAPSVNPSAAPTTLQPTPGPSNTPTAPTSTPTTAPSAAPTYSPTAFTNPCGDDRKEWGIKFPCSYQPIFDLFSKSPGQGFGLRVTLDEVFEVDVNYNWRGNSCKCRGDYHYTRDFYWKRIMVLRTITDTNGIGECTQK